MKSSALKGGDTDCVLNPSTRIKKTSCKAEFEKAVQGRAFECAVICKTCAYSEPCRFSDKTFSSIETAGINQ